MLSLMKAAALLLTAAGLTACAPAQEAAGAREVSGLKEAAGTQKQNQSGDGKASQTREPIEITEEAAQKEILRFVDVFGQPYEVEINPRVKRHSYGPDAFAHTGDRLAYTGEDYDYRLGVDVSHHNGTIDWNQVREQGYEFAILRLGYRGYGQEGTLNLDREFENNFAAAREAGLDVGVYFFAQAVNEEEALEEARFVLDHLKERKLQLPVVYDPESILDDEARTDDVTGEQFTENTLVFCQAVEEAGYEAMIYSNMLWEAYELDLERLSAYPIWYADYEPLPQTPYHFTFWQYSNTGSVEGISGDVDLNTQMIPK